MTATLEERPPRPRRSLRRRVRRADGRIPWWVGVLLAMVPGGAARVLVGSGLFNFEQLIAALVAAFVLLLIARRPAPSLAVMVVLLPFQLILTAGLYELGLAGGVTRMAALWKELVVLGVVVAAWRRSRDHPGRFDPLDRCAAAFVVLGTVYFAVPEVVVSGLGASLSIDDRFLAWRLVVLPAVLLLAGRRLRATQDELRWVLRGALVMAGVLGLIATVEFFASDWWNSLLVDTVGVNRYRTEVLGLDLASQGIGVADIRVYGEVAGRLIIRVGGPMVSHLTFSFVLLIGLAFLVERLVRQAASPLVVVGTVSCGAGLLFTQTRSTIVGGVILGVLALRAAPGRSTVRRVRYGVLAVAVLVVALPFVLSAGLTDRFTEGDELSESVHEDRVEHALQTLGDHPLGLGIGMGSIAGGRVAQGSVAVENQVLDTGVQLGILGGVLFVAQYALLIVALSRAGAQTTGRAAAAALAARNALLAMLVPLWYQAAFGLLEVSWVLFALAGVALGAAEASRERASTS